MDNELSKAIKAKLDAQMRMQEMDRSPSIFEGATGEVVYTDPKEYMLQYVAGKNVSIGTSGSLKVIHAIMNILGGENVTVSEPDANGQVTISVSIPETYTLPKANEETLGGVMPKNRTDEDLEIAVDTDTGKLYASKNLTAIETFLKGGSTGQVLTKKSHNDYDYEWTTPSSGGGEEMYFIPKRIIVQVPVPYTPVYQSLAIIY